MGKNKFKLTKFWKIFIIIIGAIIICGIALIFSIKLYNSKQIKNVDSYEKCADAGYEILATYPVQCKTPDGKTFTQTDIQEPDQAQNPNPGCQNACGDGICQEITCLSTNCQCPETPISCPKDCPN